MKFNLVEIIIAIAVSLLIAYGFYSFHSSPNKILLSIGSFIFFATTLTIAVGIKFELPRTGINLKVLSSVFFGIGLISNLFFSFINFTIPSYIIVNGILLLLFILIAYSINKIK